MTQFKSGSGSRLNKREKGCFLILLLFVALSVVILWVPNGGTPRGPASKAVFQCREIGLALVKYASDHGGRFPEGHSSTEVFQKLIDDHDVDDPALFFYPLAGKVKPGTNTLKPENVGWDVTCCVDADSPDSLPLVFITGYKVDYMAGAGVHLLKKETSFTWTDWWNAKAVRLYFVAVFYKNFSARALMSPDNSGLFPGFIPADFDSKEEIYRQLTPDGELKP